MALSIIDQETPVALRALVIEDHEFQRRMLVKLLGRLGAADVQQAADGAQALDALARADGAPADVIVCDLDMPNMDGMEFLRRLGALQSPSSVIILSGQQPEVLNSVQQMAQAYGVRLLGVLAKPARPEPLADLLRRHRPGAPARAGAHARREFSLAEIVRGIEARQFEPFFQPKAELAGNRIVGAEALARWRHPDAGIVAPGAFVQTLERGEAIDALTFLMIEKAAAACRGWRDAGHELSVSVNLSLISLADSAIAERLTALVQGAGLDPRHMTFEITESAAMTETGAALENLTRLRMRGFGLSIDDYGTGFSSMRQLTRVPFTELKIDREFVAGMATQRASRIIVESSVQLARQLGIVAVAEGVESLEEWEALKALRCDQVQGYLLSKPLPAAEFAALLERR